MSYAKIEQRLRNGDILILDGGTGTELERRGVSMSPEAWCGPATLENAHVLEDIHRDYISAGADIITANTFASSRLMLNPAGYADRFVEITQTAVQAAHKAREASGRDNILVAGSLSHMCPVISGTAKTDVLRTAPKAEMADAFAEHAMLLRDEGCDLLLLEMMYDPGRMEPAFKAAAKTGLPVWAGFSARSSSDGTLLSFLQDREVPFEDIIQILKEYNVAAAGIMHTPSNVISEALDKLRTVFDGPLTAYPDSGYFKMPQWQFEDVIAPEELLNFAKGWVENGAQVIGGCCGLSPNHIAALKPLKS